MTILPSNFTFNELPGNTIIPPLSEEAIFIEYLTRVYEDIAFAVNNKDNIFFTIPISNGAIDIPNLPSFGAFLICVSGIDSGMPTGVWALVKADANQIGTGFAVALASQVGTTGIWTGKTLLLTCSTTNFQIAHNASQTGNFNIRIVSTF